MMEDVRSAIKEANQRFMNAFKAGDAAAVAALYTPDARILPPDAQMMEGAEAIRSFWHGAMQSGLTAAKLETVDVESSGDLAYEVGRFALYKQGDGGEIIAGAGKYVVVWKRQNGGWKLAADIWNASTRAPA
jgi:uncharacterized protein (TIGR02246 family)